MNNTRRRQVRQEIDKIRESLTELQTLQEEEQESFDNLPENLQYSEKGENMERCADELQNLIDNIEMEIDEVDNILES